MSVLPLAAAKTHLNITGTTSDVELQDFIDAAEAAVARRCGPLSATAVTARVDGGGTCLVLPTTPVISLTSVTEVGGAALTLSDLYLRTGPGLVEYALTCATFPVRRYDVVYQAGRATLPADLLSAVKELVRHLWQTQRGVSRPATNTSDSLNNTLAEATATLPFRVEQLLQPHLLVTL